MTLLWIPSFVYGQLIFGLAYELTYELLYGGSSPPGRGRLEAAHHPRKTLSDLVLMVTRTNVSSAPLLVLSEDEDKLRDKEKRTLKIDPTLWKSEAHIMVRWVSEERL